MPASSLIEQCKRVCIKNISSVTDVGSFEYFQIKDILEHVKTANQLRQIEVNSPQIQGENAELWQRFIAKEIPDWHKKRYEPKNPLSWYNVYVKYKREQAAEIKRDEDILRETMLGLKKTQESKVSKVVDLNKLPKIPRDPRMLANNGGVPIGKKGFKKEGPSGLVFSAGSKTKITDGKSVLTKARREAKEISAMGKLSRPTHQLGGMGRVAKAPPAMVKEYQTASQPAGKPISSIKILTKKPGLSSKYPASSGVGGPSLEERENRLRALTTGGTKRDSSGEAKVILIGSSDEDEDVDALFDEGSASSSPPKHQHSLPASATSVTSRPIAKLNPVKKTHVLHQLNIPHIKPIYKYEPTSPKQKSPVTSSPLDRRYTPTPGPNMRKLSPPPGTLQPMYKAKKKPVDIFNRGPKKQRLF